MLPAIVCGSYSKNVPRFINLLVFYFEPVVNETLVDRYTELGNFNHNRNTFRHMSVSFTGELSLIF